MWVVEWMGSSDERRTTKPWSTVALNRIAVDCNVLLLLLTPDPFGPTLRSLLPHFTDSETTLSAGSVVNFAADIFAAVLTGSFAL